MSPIKFRLNPTYGLGGDVVWRISRWPPSERNHFSKPNSPCSPNASYQVRVQSNLRFGWRPSWISEWNVLAILNFYIASMPLIKFWLNPTYSLGGDVVWRISRWPLWWPFLILEQKDFSNSESLCRFNASHQVSAQSDLRFGRRCSLTNFKMAAMAATLDIETERVLAILNLNVATMPPTVSAQSDLRFWRCRKCEKLTTDGRTTDNRPRQNLT